MIRNLKALGLAVVAVFAMSAVAASAAQAETLFHSNSQNTTLTVTQDGAEGTTTSHHVFDAAGASITCKGFHGEAFGTAQTETDIHLENIKYTNCEFLGTTVTLNMHSCDYTFTSHTGVANFQIVNLTGTPAKTCAQDPIQFEAPGCNVKWGAQAELPGVSYHNITPEGGVQQEVTIEITVPSLQYTATGFLCPKQGQFSDGDLTTGNTVVTGEITGQQTMTRFWSEATAEKLFHSNSEKTTLIVTQDGEEGTTTAHQVLDAAGASITCRGVHGEAFGTAQTETAIHLENISYTNCEFLGFTTTLNMHSCDYTFTSHTGVANFQIVNLTGTPAKTCAQDPIQFEAPGCKVKVGAQNELSGVTYHNIGSGTTEEVTIELSVQGIQYTATGFLCPKEGQLSDGKVTTGNTIVTGEVLTHTGIHWG